MVEGSFLQKAVLPGERKFILWTAASCCVSATAEVWILSSNKACLRPSWKYLVQKTDKFRSQLQWQSLQVQLHHSTLCCLTGRGHERVNTTNVPVLKNVMCHQHSTKLEILTLIRRAFHLLDSFWKHLSHNAHSTWIIATLSSTVSFPICCINKKCCISAVSAEGWMSVFPCAHQTTQGRSEQDTVANQHAGRVSLCLWWFCGAYLVFGEDVPKLN